jgi:N-methylhydantoinase A
MHSIGIDTGGTFTDVTYVSPEGEISTLKTPTTDDLSTGVQRGFVQMVESRGLDISDIDFFAHGSTVAINTLIERTGADTALVTTRGFRDRIEIGEMYRPPERVYDPKRPKPTPLVPRRKRFEVAERVDGSGDVVEPLTQAEIDAVVEKVRSWGVDSVAVALLFAFRNPEHEERLTAAIEAGTDCTVSMASHLSKEIDEYERMATAIADAYMKPIVDRYLRRLDDDLTEQGLSVPMHVAKSSGGLARSTVVTPVAQLISGPVAGVIAAQYYGRQAGIENVITFDMGGTSCDTSTIIDGEPTEQRTLDVSGLSIKGPFTKIDSIGAGGGSIAWIDGTGSLHVGPRSAGANPGPACYGRGGEHPTVTDANLVLGMLNPEFFAGGDMELDETAAERALERIADPLGMSTREAALAIRHLVNRNMAGSVRVVTVENGRDPRNFSLMSFGGAGGLHAVDVAADMGIARVVVPDRPGVASSLGLTLADIRHNFSQSVLQTVAEADTARLEEGFRGLEADARASLDDEQVSQENQTLVRSMDIRYAGQLHTLNVLADRPLDGGSLTEMAAEFEREHDRTYGFTEEDADIQLASARLTAIGTIDVPDLASPRASGSRATADVARGEKTVTIAANRTVSATQYRSTDLLPGDAFAGPAIVEQDNSTVWIPSDWTAEVDRYRNMVITEVER